MSSWRCRGMSATLSTLLWLAGGAAGQTLEEVSIPPQNPSSSPNHLCVVDGTLFFVADDGIHGRELWMSDMSGNCTLTADIWEGQPSSAPERLTNAEGTLYFTAETARHGRTVWMWDEAQGQAQMVKSTGTNLKLSAAHFWGTGSKGLYLLAVSGVPTEGLYVVKPGSARANPVTGLWSRPMLGETPRSVVAGDGTVVYYIGNSLARSDGTLEGTYPIARVSETTDLYSTGAIHTLGSQILLVGLDEEHGRELWMTNGTPEGSGLLKDIAPGETSSDIIGFYLHEGALYFGADDGQHGKELWKTDGTAEGTVMVKDICPGLSHSDPHYYASAGQWLFFLAHDGQHGKELWKTDGTTGGTSMVVDLYPGAEGSDPWRLTGFNHTLYFCAASPVYGEEVFLTNGNAEGTRILRDIVPGTDGSGPHQLTEFNGVLFFACDDGQHGEELWLTNGTAQGTRLAADIYPLRVNPSSFPQQLTAAGERLLFVLSDAEHGQELWVSDATAEGTMLVRDIAPGLSDAAPRDLTSAGRRVFFSAEEPATGRELWCSDGTPQGTHIVRDIRPGETGAGPQQLYVVEDLLLFTADDGAVGRELWRSDGSSEGTFMLLDMTPGEDSTHVAAIFALWDTIGFCVEETDGTMAVWRTDGTREGTHRVVQVPAAAWRWNPASLTSVVGDYPRASAGTRSDVERTLLALSAQPSHGDGFGIRPVTIGQRAFFVAHTEEHGAELWETDGTSIGTRLVRDLFAGPPGSSPTHLVVHNDLLHFIAEHPTHGRALWRTNGTSSATGLVMLRTDRGTAFSIPALDVASLDEVLVVSSLPGQDREAQPEDAELRFITQESEVAGDGDALYSIRKGPAGSWPRQLTRVGKHVFFTADDGVHGRELWVTDGTPGGTHLVRDILSPRAVTPSAE